MDGAGAAVGVREMVEEAVEGSGRAGDGGAGDAGDEIGQPDGTVIYLNAQHLAPKGPAL